MPTQSLNPTPILPLVLLRPLRRLPAPLVAAALQAVLGTLLRGDDLAFLDGRRLRIRINDLGLNWLLTRADGRLQLLAADTASEAGISGNLREFALLASRREDPDSLFFQRRLLVEGDTELALQAKNLLDGIDLAALPPPLRWLLERTALALS